MTPYLRLALLMATALITAANAYGQTSLYAQAPAERISTRLPLAGQSYVQPPQALSLCVDPHWPPFEFITPDQQHQGIFAELLTAIFQPLRLTLQLVPTDSWAQSITFFKQGRCQLISGLNPTAERDQFMRYSAPYLIAPMVIVSRQGQPYVASLQSLSGQTLASVKGYRIAEEIQRHYPAIKLVYVDSTQAALTAVSQGEVYASVGSILGMSYNVAELQLENLKIIGHTEFTGHYRMGVRPELAALVPLIDQAIHQLPEQEKNTIINRWVRFMDYTAPDYTAFWWALAVAAVLGLILLVRYLSHLHYSQQLALANQKLRTANDEQETLIKMVSHQYRTPLAIINSGLRLLQQELPSLPTNIRQRLAAIGRATQRMNDTLNIVLHEQLPSVPSTQTDSCVLYDALHQVLQGLQDNQCRHKIQLEGDMLQRTAMPENAVICCLDNIVSNAVKYSCPNQGAIVIRCSSPTPDQLQLKIRDQGRGIPEAEQAAIFNKFYRATNASTTAGAGMGLVIVKQLMQQHGGSICIQNNPLQGCECTLSFPVFKNHA